jgi:hypothetical protein
MIYEEEDNYVESQIVHSNNSSIVISLNAIVARICTEQKITRIRVCIQKFPD